MSYAAPVIALAMTVVFGTLLFLALGKDGKISFEFEPRAPKAGGKGAAKDGKPKEPAPKLDFTGQRPALSAPAEMKVVQYITDFIYIERMAGAFFAISAVGYRGATLCIASDSALFRAAAALAAVTLFQSIAMGLWLRWREPGEVARVARAWKSTLPVGVAGLLGSLGWFLAFALMNAAYVRSLGQVELIFSLAVSVLVFRERVSLRELAGMGLLAAGIVGIVTAA